MRPTNCRRRCGSVCCRQDVSRLLFHYRCLSVEKKRRIRYCLVLRKYRCGSISRRAILCAVDKRLCALPRVCAEYRCRRAVTGVDPRDWMERGRQGISLGKLAPATAPACFRYGHGEAHSASARNSLLLLASQLEYHHRHSASSLASMISTRRHGNTCTLTTFERESYGRLSPFASTMSSHI
jgi:hypothetical protein